MSAYIAGELEKWPSLVRMAEILREAGLNPVVGTYSIRIKDFSHFVFQQYGGDLGDPLVDADADTVADMSRDASRVSEALGVAGIRHRFEIYDDDADNPHTIAGYFHHEWPLPKCAECNSAFVFRTADQRFCSTFGALSTMSFGQSAP
jgi:hypothetical protein